MRTEHVALLSRGFPPSAAIGARRGLRFARGLTAAGFRVSVVTLHERLYERLDPSLSTGEEPFRVVRTSTWNPIELAKGRGSRRTAASPTASVPGAKGRPGLERRAAAVLRYWARPDEEVLWVPLAIRAALRLHRSDPIDVVITSMPPYSTLLSACFIGKRTGARVVADYRDPWAATREKDPSYSPWQRWLEDRIERALLKRTDLALFTSPTARDYYRDRFPEAPPLTVLFNSIDSYVEGEGPPDSAPLCWAHAGSLYNGRRSLAPVLEAMAGTVDASQMKLVLIGDSAAEELRLAERLGIRDCLEVVGRLPLDQCLGRLRRAHRLVAVVSDEHPLQIPAKVFDYLATRRPILLLAQPGHAARDVLAGTHRHRSCAPAEVAAIRSMIREDLDVLRAGGLPDVAPSPRFEATAQIEELAQLLRTLPPTGARLRDRTSERIRVDPPT